MKEDNLTLEFIDKAKKIHGDRYVYSKVKYCKSKIKVIITCRIHGDYEQSPNSHLRGKGCRICGEIERSRKRTFMTRQHLLVERRNDMVNSTCMATLCISIDVKI